MSKVRSGVVLVALLLLGTPALGADQIVAPSPIAFVADLWLEVAEVVQAVFESSMTDNESGPILDPTGGADVGVLDGAKEQQSSADDESGPILDPGG